jgi:tetratricopeptide (TPR) repeat protein
VQLGRLYRLDADRTVAGALELLGRALVPESLVRAREIIAQSTALQPGDPRRIALSDELRQLLAGSHDSVLEGAINAADLACRDLDSARQAFTRSLEHGTDPDALAGLIDLYERAGKTSLGADLGTVTLARPELRASPVFCRAMMSSLVKLGRLRYAADVATLWVRTEAPTPGDFLAECCLVLWQAKRWPELQHAAFRLWQVGTSHQLPSTRLYIGIALIEQNDTRGGRQFLREYAASEEPEPFPKARATAWLYMARASRTLGEATEERLALRGLVEAEPELDADAWLRLAELQFASPHGGYREPEELWARGMSLAPKRTSELMEKWGQIGVMELNAIGLDLVAVRADLAHGKIFTPPADASAYQLYRLAELHADAGDVGRAAVYVRKLLENLPGFVPALDLAIKIAHLQKKPKERMAYILERVRLAGRTSAIDKILRELPLDEFQGKDLLELMRADPDRSGRLALAQGLASEGRADEALALVAPLSAETLGDEGHVLLARLHMARRAPVRALAVLAPLAPGIFSTPQALELLVRAGCGAGDRERMNQLGLDLAALIDDEPPVDVLAADTAFKLSRARALWVVDQFLAFGFGDAAQPILDALDESPRLRGGDVNLRLVTCAVVRGDLEAAHVALDRAQAFDTGGAADFIALVLAAYEGRADELRYLAGVTATSGFVKGALLTAQLMILGERGDEAALLLKDGLSRLWKDDAWWNLTAFYADRLHARTTPFQMSPYLGRAAKNAAGALLDDAEAPLDPRFALVWISAARNPAASPILHAWLAKQESRPGNSNLWLEWMRATLATQWDAGNTALTVLERIRTQHPDFGPAWDVEAAVLNSTVRSPAELKAARARRGAALGELAESRVDQLLDAAEAKVAAGQLEEALASATEAVTLEPKSVSASITVAWIQGLMGQHVTALQTMRSLLEARTKTGVASSAKGRCGHDLVSEFLLVVDAARKQPDSVVTHLRATTILEQLRRALQHDSRIVLAEAELDLERDPRNPTFGVARAYTRLERFRKTHRTEPVERLGTGSIRAWTRFYAALDPRRARSFVEEQLAIAPTVAESWIELARAREAEGDQPGALEQMQLTARLAPQDSVQREILRVRATGEMAHEAIVAAANEIRATLPEGTNDAELAVLEARCLLNQGPRALERIGALIRNADPTALSPESARDRTLLMAMGLLMRGRAEDKQTALSLLDGLRQKETDRYVLGFADVLTALAKAP